MTIFLGGFKQFNSIAQKDQNPEKIKLRTFQDVASPITKSQVNIKFKVFQNPSQSTIEFQKLWRDSIRCLKITEDKTSKRGPHAKRKGRVLILNTDLVFCQQTRRSH